MSGYTKLFGTILASTVWREANHVRIVWITLLAMADKNGIAEGSVPGLADFARVSVEECRDALRRLSDPDRDSRTTDHEGRRIAAVDGGWQLLNHAKYRQKMSADERREYNRQKQQESRERRRCVNVSQQASSVVNDNLAQSALSAHTEAEAEAEADPKADTEPKAEPRAQSQSPPPAFPRQTPRGPGLITSSAAYDRQTQFNAWIGARLTVPRKLHTDFLSALGGLDADTKLRAWYATVDEEIERTAESISPSVWKWLDARFKAWLPSVATQGPAADAWGGFKPKD